MATQCRPTLKDNLPQIWVRKPNNHSGLMLINGLYRHGFMISPAVMDCALEFIDHGDSQTAVKLGLKLNQDHLSEEVSACVSL
jgi:glycine oxidase